MRIFLRCLGFVMVFFWLTALNSVADSIRFTATSTQYGVMGYLEYDSSIFNTFYSRQFFSNDFLLDIDFVDPISGYEMNTPGPINRDSGAYFYTYADSLPTLWSGAGYTGGTNLHDGLRVDSHAIIIGTGDYFNTYYDINWASSLIKDQPVPEPATMILMLVGMMGLGGTKLRKKKSQ